MFRYFAFRNNCTLRYKEKLAWLCYEYYLVVAGIHIIFISGIIYLFMYKMGIFLVNLTNKPYHNLCIGQIYTRDIHNILFISCRFSLIEFDWLYKYQVFSQGSVQKRRACSKERNVLYLNGNCPTSKHSSAYGLLLSRTHWCSIDVNQINRGSNHLHILYKMHVYQAFYLIQRNLLILYMPFNSQCGYIFQIMLISQCRRLDLDVTNPKQCRL